MSHPQPLRLASCLLAGVGVFLVAGAALAQPLDGPAIFHLSPLLNRLGIPDPPLLPSALGRSDPAALLKSGPGLDQRSARDPEGEGVHVPRYSCEDPHAGSGGGGWGSSRGRTLQL